ncbi:MAG TPA: sensor histidine kinase [Acidiferrobacteraceae bacterium]|nr:sensor histidine kinase [Acidiferrobacteraceae bacterium]
MPEDAQDPAQAPSWLPNLATGAVALRVLVAAELVALALALARNPWPGPTALRDFVLLSGYALAIAATGLLGLRVLARPLQRLSIGQAFVWLFVLLLCVIFGVTEGLVAVLGHLGYLHAPSPGWQWSVLARALLLGSILGFLGLRYLAMTHRAQLDAKREQESRMQALQSRIRPHFLFNSMNSVASLTRSDPARAETALQDLADLFRVLLADARKLVPISAEREISRQYLEIEKLRLGDRLKVTWNVSNVPRTALIPALTLQPLLENAIYHGIEPRFGGGTVRIELWTEGDRTLNIMISNPMPEVPKRAHGKGNKIALDNIRQRLETYFGSEASLQTLEEGGQYHVKVRMPITRG